MTLYRIGQQVDLRVTFLSDTTPTDPAAVNIRIRKPDGTLVTETYPGGQGAIVRETTGKYLYVLDVDVSGVYTYEWTSTGNLKTAEERQLSVARKGT